MIEITHSQAQGSLLTGTSRGDRTPQILRPSAGDGAAASPAGTSPVHASNVQIEPPSRRRGNSSRAPATTSPSRSTTRPGPRQTSKPIWRDELRLELSDSPALLTASTAQRRLPARGPTPPTRPCLPVANQSSTAPAAHRGISVP